MNYFHWRRDGIKYGVVLTAGLQWILICPHLHEALGFVGKLADTRDGTETRTPFECVEVTGNICKLSHWCVFWSPHRYWKTNLAYWLVSYLAALGKMFTVWCRNKKLSLSALNNIENGKQMSFWFHFSHNITFGRVREIPNCFHTDNQEKLWEKIRNALCFDNSVLDIAYERLYSECLYIK